MTTVLTAISGQFSKSLFLAAFTPVVIFAILALTLIEPLLPADWASFAFVASLGTEWQVVAVLLIGIVLANLLYNLNIPIIRLYEGYPWERVGSWLTRIRQDQLLDLDIRFERMLLLRRVVRDEDPARSEVEQWLARLGAERRSDWPRDTTQVLPTRLGNVIRSFEQYADSQYNMESITLWSRMVAKIDAGYAGSVVDAKTAFDFMLNSSLLSALLAVLTLCVGLWFGMPAGTPALTLRWLVTLLSLAALSYLLYLASIGRARAWGDMVKGAYDLYRWDLLKQLGYKYAPETMEHERKLWGEISDQMLYGDSPGGPRPSSYGAIVSPDVPLVRSDPAITGFTVRRRVEAKDGGELVVTIFIQNIDREGREAACIQVDDTMPTGHDYKIASARSPSYEVRVIGANPYTFYLIGDPVPENEWVRLTYGAVRRSE